MSIVRLIFFGVSLSNRVALWFTDRAIKLQPSHFNNKIDGCEIFMCFDEDPVDRSPRDRWATIHALWSSALYSATSPAIRYFRWNLVPHRRKEEGLASIKQGTAFRPCVAHMGLVRPPFLTWAPLTRGAIKCQPKVPRGPVGAYVCLRGTATCARRACQLRRSRTKI